MQSDLEISRNEPHNVFSEDVSPPFDNPYATPPSFQGDSDGETVARILKSRETRRNEIVRSVLGSDPLRMDPFFVDMMQGRRTDIHSSVAVATARAALDLFDPDNTTPVYSFAILRDLEFVVAHATTNGISLGEIDSRLEPTLLACGSTVQMPPRGNIYTYGVMNPLGSRARTYTGAPEELALIRSLNVGGTQLDHAAESLDGIRHLRDPNESLGLITHSLELTRDAMRDMHEAMIIARRDVGAPFFTLTLSRNVKAASINGTYVEGPNPARLAVPVIDHLLFDRETIDGSLYTEYLGIRIPYLTPAMHAILERQGLPRVPDVLSSIQDTAARQRVQELLEAIHTEAVKFRYPHRALAREAVDVKGKKHIHPDEDALDMLARSSQKHRKGK